MTTIAIDASTISADGLAVCNNIKTNDKLKKIIKRKGVIYAMAGRVEHCRILVDYLSEESDELINDIDGNVISIENNEIRVHWVKDGVIDSDRVEPPYSMGTGGDYAYSAMRLGFSSKDAVKHAGSIDLNTNANITTMKWKK